MDKQRVEQYLKAAEEHLAAARVELNKPDIPEETIIDCAGLQKALAIGGAIKLTKDSFCSTTNFFEVKGDTQLFGEFSTLHGDSYSIQVKPGQHNGMLRDLSLTTKGRDCVLNLGYNGEAQNQLNMVPTGWLLENLKIKNYLGKRGIGLNSANTKIKNSIITGIVHPDHIDSQAICALNTPGGFIAEDCQFSAASECVLIGGDSPKLPVLRRNLIFIRCEFFKDIDWKADGTPTKNLFEAKDGWDVLLQDCKLHTCWVDGQAGEAYMLTPTNGGQVSVTILNNEVWDVSSICNITGVDKNLINTVRTQVTFNGGTYKTNKAKMGGRGNFALLDRGPEFLRVNNCDITIDGTTLIDFTGTAKMDFLEITNSRFNYGRLADGAPGYGIRIGGLNDGDNSKGLIGTVRIEGNTIIGAKSGFRGRYPNNTYV